MTCNVCISLLLLSLFDSSFQQCDHSVLNSAADYLLAEVISMYNDSAELPNVKESFHWGTIQVSLKDGTLYGLSDAARVGDVRVTALPSGTTEAVIDLRFNKLTVMFDEYTVTVVFFPSHTGKASATVKKNLVRVTLVITGPCHMEVGDVEFLSFGKFDVQLSEPIRQVLLYKVIETFDTLVKKSVEEQIKKTMGNMSADYLSYCFFRN